MSGPVSMQRDGAVAVIIVDNPPVNALKYEVRAGMLENFTQAATDKSVEAIVLTGAGRTFMAGADITEFGKPMKAPGLSEVIAAIEKIQKPTIAAVHGTPLGGGLEVTLGCHFRVAAPGTRLGLPEIKLGIIPGAGGTQLLPRLVGVEKGLAMILSGDPIPAKEALAAGLVDEIIEGDLVKGAVAFAKKVIAEKRPLKHVRDLDDKIAPFRANPEKFNEAAANVAKKSRGLEAPLAAIEAVRAAVTLPVDEGLKRERELFVKLVAGEQSKAQRYIFFAEREAAKIPGMPAGLKPREVARAAVIGAGTMGGGISMSFVNAGIPVTVVETGEEALKRGFDTIKKNYQISVQRGALKQEDADKRFALLKGTTSMDGVKDADIVIEAVFEEMNIKKEVFGVIDKLAKPSAVLATNTSYLNVDQIAQTTKRPKEVLGTHFFSPANVMKLLEIVRGKETAPDVLATAMAVGRKIGKVPVVVGVCHGFVGNRMLSPRQNQAERLLLEGALPRDVDAAAVEFGFPMGPFAMSDLAGIDVGWRIRKALGTRNEIADALADMGRFGQKTGRGFYIYEKGSRSPIPDPEVEEIIVAASKRLGIPRRQIDKKEIIERLVFPMINEGAKILDEGIAYRASDIDVIWVYGYGWPIWRGGPMYYADHVGLAYIRDQLAKYAKASDQKMLEPSPLLLRLAAENGSFASFGAKKSAA
ncbi:MAG TPA: 3-hydroxyacyl-CoA dehydrogenase NAD-binding domain-containing protein [Xanthobacteraceae bacterium]|nr:3-hydroxyacyl-CoA dehydrogenase NAD-binding domain-containing protein [Xanthobacteraceae bacterium]